MQILDQLVASANVDTHQSGWRTRLPKPTMLTFTPGQTWRARMVTSKGELVIKLLTDTAPMHVTSFAYLARLGFYRGEVTGDFDAATRQALVDFQGWENLEGRIREGSEIDALVLQHLRKLAKRNAAPAQR